VFFMPALRVLSPLHTIHALFDTPLEKGTF